MEIAPTPGIKIEKKNPVFSIFEVSRFKSLLNSLSKTMNYFLHLRHVLFFDRKYKYK